MFELYQCPRMCTRHVELADWIFEFRSCRKVFAIVVIKDSKMCGLVVLLLYYKLTRPA